MAFIYATAVTLNGFLADAEHSLDWLNAVSSAGTAPNTFAYSALVMGSHTYGWLLRHENLLAQPEKWPHYFGTRPVFVFSSRALPVPAGADVRLLQGGVAQHLAAIRTAAAGGDVWIQGGGDLAGQFLEAGALDEIILDVAPATLASGGPLLPRTVLWPRLRLLEARPNGEFAHLHWRVVSDALEDTAQE